MKSISAICIKPGGVPVPCYIEQDILSLAEMVNTDKDGNLHPDFEPFEIFEIKDNINVISSPKGEERGLPLVRTIGRYTNLYGVVYIVKMDHNNELIDLSREERIDYCVKFVQDTISLEELGLPSVDYYDEEFNCYDDLYDENNYSQSQKDDGYRRVTITFDEPEDLDDSEEDW